MKKMIKNIGIGILLVFGLVLVLLSHRIGGLQLFIVSSASMEPTISTGSLLVTKYTDPQELQKGDIITFLPPEKNATFVTHRITEVTHQENLSTFRTKGDNNPGSDLWNLAGGAIVGKVIFSIPFLGYLFSFTQSKIGIILFILLPATYIIVDELTNSVKLISSHKKRQASKE